MAEPNGVGAPCTCAFPLLNEAPIYLASGSDQLFRSGETMIHLGHSI
jgi:hypothetical protein